MAIASSPATVLDVRVSIAGLPVIIQKSGATMHQAWFSNLRVPLTCPEEVMIILKIRELETTAAAAPRQHTVTKVLQNPLVPAGLSRQT
jgi:hypothetical protein